MEKTQREYYLNEQMKAIQNELGEIEDGENETSHLQKSILKAKMSKEATKKMFVRVKEIEINELDVCRGYGCKKLS